MKIARSWTFPADTERAYAMLTDPAYQEAKAQETGTAEHTVSITPDGDGHVIVVHRVWPTEKLPDLVRGALGRSLRIIETQRWGGPEPDGTRRAALTVVVENQPAKMSGAATLAPQGDRSKMSVDGDLKVSVPLIGGQIEKAAAPAFLSGLAAEERVGGQFLRDQD